MTNNTTEYNVEFHSEYSRGDLEGVRVPIDDRGSSSLGDRGFALGSQDPLWSKGSINRAVKEMHDLNGGEVEPEDLYNYENGLMDIDTISKYIYRESLWGFKGDSRYTTPADMMSFRGYPTPNIKSIRFLNIELNQNTSVTQNGLNESVSATSDAIPFQFKKEHGDVFPVTPDADYVFISGVVELYRRMPFDSIYISLKQMIELENYIDGGNGYDKMWSGDFSDDDFACKTECFNDGSGFLYYFRLYGETLADNLGGEHFIPRDLKLRLSNYSFGAYKDDAIYSDTGLLNSEIIPFTAFWENGKWRSSGEVWVDETPPSKPINLRNVALLSNMLELEWDASSDNIGVKHYISTIRDKDSPYTHEIISTDTRANFVVNADTSYELTVIAVDYAGNRSEVSDIFEFTTVMEQLQVAYRNNTMSFESNDACIAGTPTIEVWVEDSLAFINGTYTGKVYTDQEGESPFNGLDAWWSFARFNPSQDRYSMQIDLFGSVIGYNPC